MFFSSGSGLVRLLCAVLGAFLAGCAAEPDEAEKRFPGANLILISLDTCPWIGRATRMFAIGGLAVSELGGMPEVLVQKWESPSIPGMMSGEGRKVARIPGGHA